MNACNVLPSPMHLTPSPYLCRLVDVLLYGSHAPSSRWSEHDRLLQVPVETADLHDSDLATPVEVLECAVAVGGDQEVARGPQEHSPPPTCMPQLQAASQQAASQSPRSAAGRLRAAKRFKVPTPAEVAILKVFKLTMTELQGTVSMVQRVRFWLHEFLYDELHSF